MHFRSPWLCKQSYCRGAGVHHWSSVVRLLVRRSINYAFPETTTWIQATFYGKLPVHHISNWWYLFLFSIFLFSKFYEFISFYLTWDPVGGKLSKCYSSHGFGSISNKLYNKYVSHVQYRRSWQGNIGNIDIFNLGVKGNILKYAISSKWLPIERIW